jgi:hypothetical protein
MHNRDVIPEAPFLFSIAALSASLAGLAGLVAALRRGADLRSMDAFRLREIVEFAFANIVLCVIIVPLAQLLPGGTPDAIRLAAVAAIAYIVGSSLVLAGRQRRANIEITRGWTLTASSVLVAALVAAAATAVTASIPLYQLLVVILLVRPMAAFLLVLASFEAGAPSGPKP